MYQKNLLYTQNLSINYVKKLEYLFSLISYPNTQKPVKRRPPHPKHAILNALIFKNLRSVYSLLDLSRELKNYPQLAQVCGFKSFPSHQRFSDYLKTTPNEKLQYVRLNLLKQLISSDQISGYHISGDACPIKSNVKENNLKTIVKERYNKHKFPKGDTEARLGTYTVFFPEKKVQYFWGYRNHILNDCISELPVAEITKPANVHESKMFIPQLKHIKKELNLPIKAVMADAAFDSYRIINFIFKKFKAKPVIARNPRNSKNLDVTLSSTGHPICAAGFQMKSMGKFYDKKHDRRRHEFVCPIKVSKKFARNVGGLCPWDHPKFYSNRYGCITNLRIDVDTSIRDNINYGSETFKKLYDQRTSSERIFSRLLSFMMQMPSVKGLNATANCCTIAHITVLLIALAAAKTGNFSLTSIFQRTNFVKPYVSDNSSDRAFALLRAL